MRSWLATPEFNPFLPKPRLFVRLARAHAVYLVADPCRADRFLRVKARHRVLIFCRKPGERFRVGDDVVVTVERVRGQRVLALVRGSRGSADRAR